jgi:hypothetical protein
MLLSKDITGCMDAKMSRERLFDTEVEVFFDIDCLENHVESVYFLRVFMVTEAAKAGVKNQLSVGLGKVR